MWLDDFRRRREHRLPLESHVGITMPSGPLTGSEAGKNAFYSDGTEPQGSEQQLTEHTTDPGKQRFHVKLMC